MAKMSKEEIEQWDKLYQYVKSEILLYDDSQSIPPNLCLRLKGLCKGKYIVNNNTSDKANYSYETILNTFMFKKKDILNAISKTTFNSEKHKFNYICKIVESNINDVYLRIKSNKKTSDKINSTQTDILSSDNSNYKRKTKDITNKRLESLW